MKIINLNNENLTILISEIHRTIRDNPLIALCGGRSVAHITNEMLAQIKNNKAKKFCRASYITIDERLVDRNHSDYNFKLLNEIYFKNLPEINAQPFNCEEISRSLKQYEKILLTFKTIDLTILGVGEDGHIAGLFPNLTWDDSSSFFTFHNSPKPPQNRMTAAAKTIEKSENIILLFLGDAKKEAFSRFLKAEEDQSTLPCLIAKKCPNLFVVTDIEP